MRTVHARGTGRTAARSFMSPSRERTEVAKLLVTIKAGLDSVEREADENLTKLKQMTSKARSREVR